MLMKKTAVLIYDSFCNFEISVALEILALAGKEIVVFAQTRDPVMSEEGLRVLPDQTIDEINMEEYDSLLLAGAQDIRRAIEDENVIESRATSSPRYPITLSGLDWHSGRCWASKFLRDLLDIDGLCQGKRAAIGFTEVENC